MKEQISPLGASFFLQKINFVLFCLYRFMAEAVLQIILTQSEVTLKLLKNGRALDLQTTKYYHDLSDVLITGLDKLLKRNKLDHKSLKSYKILGDLGKDSTSYKIAFAFIQGLKI